MKKQQRIWELDALRGFCILCVIVLHFLYDLQAVFGWQLMENPVIYTVMQYGGILFVLLSGLCATLGRRSFRRGVFVFGCGMVITLVTVVMVKLGMMDESVVIWFGVLHLLGICMMVWPLFRRLPVWALLLLGLAMTAAGYWFETILVESRRLFPLGLRYPGFATSDYFPLFPNLGWFLLGAVIGRTAYGEKKSLLPDFPVKFAFLRWCGTHSLWIYLLHQPVLYGLLMLLTS